MCPAVNAALLLRQLFHFRTADTCASVVQPSDRHRQAPGSTARPRSRLRAPASRSPGTGRAPLWVFPADATELGSEGLQPRPAWSLPLTPWSPFSRWEECHLSPMPGVVWLNKARGADGVWDVHQEQGRGASLPGAGLAALQALRHLHTIALVPPGTCLGEGGWSQGEYSRPTGPPAQSAVPPAPAPGDWPTPPWPPLLLQVVLWLGASPVTASLAGWGWGSCSALQGGLLGAHWPGPARGPRGSYFSQVGTLSLLLWLAGGGLAGARGRPAPLSTQWPKPTSAYHVRVNPQADPHCSLVGGRVLLWEPAPAT